MGQTHSETLLEGIRQAYANDKSYQPDYVEAYDTSAGNTTFNDINVHSFKRGSFEVVATAIAGGADSTVTLEHSNDGTNWQEMIDILGNVAEVILPVGASVNVIAVESFVKRKVRAKFVVGAGIAGTIDINFHGRGI